MAAIVGSAQTPTKCGQFIDADEAHAERDRFRAGEPLAPALEIANDIGSLAEGFRRAGIEPNAVMVQFLNVQGPILR